MFEILQALDDGASARLLVCLVVAAIGLAGAAFPAVSLADPPQITTSPSLYPDFDPSVPDYVTRCTQTDPVQVSVTAPAGTTVDVDAQGPRTGTFNASVRLSVGQEFPMVVDDGTTSSAHYVRCLPSDFPAWTFTRSGTPQAEWFAMAPTAKTYGALFDGNGVPVWWFDSKQRSLDFKLLPNGDVAWDHNSTGVEERGLNGSLVRFVTASGAVTDAHEVLLLPNGDYIVEGLRTVTGQNVCGQLNVSVIDSGVQEVRPDGSLVWSWWASDHIPLSEVPAAWCTTVLTGSQPYDAYHMNSIEPDGDGYIISFRHLDALYRLRQADGSIDWKLGGTPRTESLTVLNDPNAVGDDLFRGQHDARLLPDGTLTLHDNGFHPGSTRTPRAPRYSIDTTARTATLLQEMTDPETISAPLCCGSVRVLAGGDWVISWGNSNRVTELAPDGSRVFKLAFTGAFTYRAQPIPFGTVDRSDVRAAMDAQYGRTNVRPKGATPVRVPLVPAYAACASPDTTHGAPLSFGSCSSPRQTSSYLTAGTPDVNGQAANFTGSVRYTARPGDPTTPANEADVRVSVSLTDVRRRADLSDYTGQLQVHSGLRITDRQNGSGGSDPATGLDTDVPVTVPCTATASTSTGATCSVSTTLDAIVPDAVVEGKRADWELGQVQVFDGGASGVAGASDARLFADQGVFVP